MPFSITEMSKESTLWQTRLGARQIPSSPFNVWTVAIVFVVAVLYASFTRTGTPNLAQRTRELAELGFNFTIGILGFLIAGFTVFATITKEELFRSMATAPKQGTKLSTLKYNLFAFMRVFFDYLCFASICLAIKILAPIDGPIDEFFTLVQAEESKAILARTGYVGMVTLLVYVLIILKSFVMNIYKFVITTIQFSFVNRPPTEEELTEA